MKLVFITDIHYGVRGDSQAFLDNNKKFFDNIFFPYLNKNHIDTVICLGDLLDRRKYINYNTAHRLRKDFLDPLKAANIDFHWILGNHDIYFRNTNEVSAASELCRDIKSYSDPTEVTFGGDKMLFVPWICESNRALTEEMLKTTKAKIVLGHLELSGFEMQKGVLHKEGDSKDGYQRFPFVATGHYHHKSDVDNIHYLGAHAEFTWSDWNDPRGFHLFDTETHTLEFIQNPYRMFEKIFYDDTSEKSKGAKFSELKGKYVKLIVKSQTDSDKFNWFMSKVEEAQPLELTVVQDHLNLENITTEDIAADAKDTITLMREFVSQAGGNVNTPKLENLVTGLYQEAVNLR